MCYIQPFRVASQALWDWYGCPGASKVTLKNMCKIDWYQSTTRTTKTQSFYVTLLSFRYACVSITGPMFSFFLFWASYWTKSNCWWFGTPFHYNMDANPSSATVIASVSLHTSYDNRLRSRMKTLECQIEGQACLFIFHFLLTWPELIWPYPFIF